MQACYWIIEKLPGLSQQQQTQLKNCGITTTQDLLERGKTVQLKQTLAHKLGMNIVYINKWIALADLARLPSVGCQYCGLLLHSGIASIPQLSQTPAYRLHRQILRLQVATMQRKDLCPPVELVQQWIAEARSLL
ncbi:DUF4332 domain-containing protein [Gloeothece verrucosa]|uniref:DUF4332 domain-containing protein n=1 Tax=Gloeothece verrucosa (strain PCC 7822) TaxID=497965 RepID=E0UBY3_GLOV7|nr:DUF4332 domain-containing protein [Gloeothece verrucosa]ADN15198.1 conserved hypothetical protein [Gloeothece verrucosa PCC 7822]